MKKSSRFKDHSVEELKALYHEISKEIFVLRNEKAVSRKLDKPSVLRGKVKDRARVLTFLRQKSGSLSL
ncbi:MAG: 50S ribosomal protein L29 [Simkania sp.]|nr:50S ribosomal protein L29 [Simkania sp.]